MARKKHPVLFARPHIEHGGALAAGKRRSRRPLNTRQALHVTLRSDLASGPRSLLNHQGTIAAVISKAARRFRVRVYRRAVCGNHIHLLIKGRTRIEIQNFFRVLAGHIAQEILAQHPLAASEQRPLRGAKKNHRKFWESLLYSRVVSWGRDFGTVARYIYRNVLEALNLIAYRPRRRSWIHPAAPA